MFVNLVVVSTGSKAEKNHNEHVGETYSFGLDVFVNNSSVILPI